MQTPYTKSAGRMHLSTAVSELRARLAQVDDLEGAENVLQWDQQVNMPPGGAEARAHHVSTLRSLAHGMFVADETGELLERAAAETSAMPYDSDDASLVRVTRREFDKMRRVPQQLIADRAHAFALAFKAWEKARAQSDFASFRPHMERIVELTIAYADALGYEDCPYDALLDRFEPGMKTAQVTNLFGQMRSRIVPLVQSIAERGEPVDDGFLHRDYRDETQWEFGLLLLDRMGFDLERGRVDRSTHPFTQGISPDDVRLTTRIVPERLFSGLFATIHEGGHALYNQGLPASLGRTSLRRGASYAVHESQSRLWENLVARSREFWKRFLPDLRRLFPEQLADVELDAFYRAVNRVEPSLIRVEADEATYNLHIFVRFELEIAIVERRLEVADLPAAWNDKMRSYLGITPPDDRRGVLQDVHWSGGHIGYFPTYALGNLLAVQFYNRARAAIPDLEQQIADGAFLDLLTWLRENVHCHGSKFMPAELVMRAAGSEIDAAPYLDYLETKYGRIYNL
jgi:carboxypeptidase Taq